MTPLFRPATPADLPFVISNWSASYKISYQAGAIHDEDWPTIMHPQIRKTIERPGAMTLVAYEKADPTFFYGFICGDMTASQPVVFYVYVKAPYRRHGIARQLFAAMGIDPTRPFLYGYKTPIVSKIERAIPWGKLDALLPRYSKKAPCWKQIEKGEPKWKR